MPVTTHNQNTAALKPPVLNTKGGCGKTPAVAFDLGKAEKYSMGPIAKKLRKRFMSYSHAVAVPHGQVWAIEISAGRQGVKLLSDDAGKILEFLSEQSACGYIAEALEGL